MWRRRSGVGAPRQVRTWSACITVGDYVQMAAARSDRDDHDDQIMAAAHDAARLMRRAGAECGLIHLFRHVDGASDELAEWRTVTFDERGLAVSANQMTAPYRDPIASPDPPPGMPPRG